MESLIMYYYELLSKKVEMNISPEEYEKSIELIKKYISRYECSYSDPLWDSNNSCYNIPLYIEDECCGVIKLSNKSISVAFNKNFDLVGIKLTEYLIVNSDKYEGNFVSFVPNLSETSITVDGEDQTSVGAIVSTKFNDKGIVKSNNDIIEYDYPDEYDHLDEAYGYHILAFQEQFENFSTFEEFNIVSVNIKTK